MKLLQLHAAISTILLIVLSLVAFSGQTSEERFDEITVGRINVVDSLENVRVTLWGGYPPRRPELAGLLFHNPDGSEAGGLVYHGKKDDEGNIQAGGILTFDQYQNDQIVALQYVQTGSRKRHGLTLQDRPDELSDLVIEAYGAIQNAPTPEARDSLSRYYRSIIPPEDLVTRRLFIGRDYSRSSVVTLSDIAGKPRLKLEVDSLGQARITFLDQDGEAVRVIEP